MKNSETVDSEEEHVFITGATIEGEEKTTENGIIFVQDRPIAFSSDASE